MLISQSSQPADVDAALASDDDQTVASVLSAQARTRGISELWTTAVGGSMNALLLLTQFHGLRWLGAGFLAVAAYGVWGLLDRRLDFVQLEKNEPPGSARFVWLLRGGIAVVGFGATLYAVGAFLTAALGPLSLPGR